MFPANTPANRAARPPAFRTTSCASPSPSSWSSRSFSSRPGRWPSPAP